MKVEVGCGKKRREGYECYDVRDLPGVDHICKADELPFPAGSVDEVYSRHLIEHLTLKEFLKTLTEWSRVLKVGGVVYIICPNLLWHLKQILEGSHESLYQKESGKNARYWGFGSLFGWQQDEYDVHKFGYYFELLRDILSESGFEDIENLTNQPDSLEHAPWHLEVRATKKAPAKEYTQSKFYTLFDVSH
ncbi:MAG: methyltransferase domain-containing protein [Patescibacteria group bacterium]|nr:methyltransferase domain-containing protein [Patescibacteria group bacterium]